MRRWAIWASGLTVSGAGGLVIGELINGPHSIDRSILGLLAALSAFACARLWIVESRRNAEFGKRRRE